MSKNNLMEIISIQARNLCAMYHAGLDHLTMDVLEFWKETNSNAKWENIMKDIITMSFSKFKFFLKFFKYLFSI